jgi:uncharacterized membrane protein
MNFIWILLLAVAVWVLWTRVGSLQRKVEQLEKALSRLLREERGVRQETINEPPAAAMADALAELRQRQPVSAPSQTHAAPAASASAPPRSAAPAPESALIRVIRDYFTGGNLVVRVGIIVLFFGVGFLLKYAAEHSQISIQVRFLGVALGAFGLFALGWRLRQRRRGFALALQGGAVGVLYLTLFAALRLYHLVSPGATFAMMAALGVVSSLFAIRQNSLAFSFLGATGGFLAPILASTGEGSHVVLFSYYALLNLGVVAQAWFKAWRPLNLLAFVFTFGIGTVWGVLRYDPAQFASTEPFLLFFFLAFIAIAVLFAFRSAPQLTHYVDGTLVFGTPVVAMALQMAMVREIPHGRAYSAIGAGLVYLLLSAWLHRTRRETLRLLMESFLALGVAFLTLAVPLLLDDTWTAATWALEGAALIWVGVRQQRWLSAGSGALLQLAAALSFIGQAGSMVARMPVANAHYMGALLLSVAGLFSARVAAQPNSLLKPYGQLPSNLFLAWGLWWWLYASANELHEFLPAHWLPGSLLGLCALTALAAGVLVKPLTWPALRVPALLILPVMIAAAYWWFVRTGHPSTEGGWLAWPMAFAVWCCCLWWHESSLEERHGALLHGAALWLLSLLASWEISWQVSQVAPVNTAWAGAVWGLVPATLLSFTAGSVVEKLWPLRRYPRDFRSWWALGLAALLGIWSLWMNFDSNGNVAPLPYLPLLNPLDIAVGMALLVVAGWLVMVWRAGDQLFTVVQQRWLIGALTGASFFWLNAVLLRTMHQWRGVPYEFDALLADTAVQTALSIFWTLLALGAMLWANRSLQRVVWFGGATLMAVVVAKLFLVDLARIGTVPRIVSFLVVGGLMLVIGYYSPLPPAAPEKPRES